MLRIIMPFLLALTLTALFAETWRIVQARRRLWRLAGRVNAVKGGGTLSLAERLLGWYGNRAEIGYRLARAGHPKYLGQTPAHFYASKLVLALACALFFGQSGWSLLFYGLGGFFAPDALIWLGEKKRREQMLEELPDMLDFLRKSLSSGAQLPQTLAILPDRLQGPLREEVVRLGAHYNLTMDLDAALEEFSRRVTLDEVDNMILALKQGEQTGKIKKLLGQQYEMLKSRMSSDLQKSTKNRANFLPLVSVLMVANIMLLVVTPMALRLMSDSFFKH